jgi:hypothetical protein
MQGDPDVHTILELDGRLPTPLAVSATHCSGHALLEPRDVLVVRHGSTRSLEKNDARSIVASAVSTASKIISTGRGSHADAPLRADARARHGAVRKKLAAGIQAVRGGLTLVRQIYDSHHRHRLNSCYACDLNLEI